MSEAARHLLILALAFMLSLAFVVVGVYIAT